MSAPDGSFGSAARLAASSGVRDSAGAGCTGARVDSFAPAGASRTGGALSRGSAGEGCGAWHPLAPRIIATTVQQLAVLDLGILFSATMTPPDLGANEDLRMDT